jgi:transposase-like protein
MYPVIIESWVKGASSRKAKALVPTIRSEAGVSRSKVRRTARGSPDRSRPYWSAPRCQLYPYLYLDATYMEGRLGKTLQVYTRAFVVAMGANAVEGRSLLKAYYLSTQIRELALQITKEVNTFYMKDARSASQRIVGQLARDVNPAI